MKTPTTGIIERIVGGEIWYHGIAKSLQKSQLVHSINGNMNIFVNFNIDGMNIHNNGKKQFWPILMNIVGMPEIKPFIVAVFYGKSKPTSAEEFLRNFVTELNLVQRFGVNMENNVSLKVKLNAFICDSPARAFVKCIKAHNAYSSCNKCTVIGEYDTNGFHMSFPRFDCPLRTHNDFINKIDEDHHHFDAQKREFIKSPLEDVDGIDMINSFPVADCMHLIELGQFCIFYFLNLKDFKF